MSATVGSPTSSQNISCGNHVTIALKGKRARCAVGLVPDVGRVDRERAARVVVERRVAATAGTKVRYAVAESGVIAIATIDIQISGVTYGAGRSEDHRLIQAAAAEGAAGESRAGGKVTNVHRAPTEIRRVGEDFDGTAV